MASPRVWATADHGTSPGAAQGTLVEAAQGAANRLAGVSELYMTQDHDCDYCDSSIVTATLVLGSWVNIC